MNITSKILTPLAVLIIAISPSCTHESYETGDGDLSYYQQQWANLTIQNNILTGITLDDNSTLLPPDNLSISTSGASDTIVRCVIGYTQQSATQPITLYSATAVRIPNLLERNDTTEVTTDPLKLNSIFSSGSGKYINLSLGIMTGNDHDEDQLQTLYVTLDSLSTHNAGAMYLTLCHDQNDVPQYYTQTVYLTILPHVSMEDSHGQATDYAPDTVNITIPTYEGEVTKQFIR